MKIRLKLIFVCMLIFSTKAFGDSDLLKGADIEYGEYLSSECSACHHKAGAKKGIPSLTNLDAERFVYLLKAYRSKELKNAVMRSVAGRLDDNQIASLVLYFTSSASQNN